MINCRRGTEGSIWNRCFLLIFMQVILVQSQHVFTNDYTNINATGLTDPTFLNQFTELVYQRLSGATSELIQSGIVKKASFCIADPEEDWNRSFNYSSNLDFLSKCILKTQGDLPLRLCTASELKFYFANFIARADFLQPNRNCNLNRWVDGCEPGWACSLGSVQPVDSTNSDEIPARTSDCQACCEGFFCPRGLTCMIPCPLGSYCPLATFNQTTGLCYPYLYQLPPEKPNHTCGGANVWADVSRSRSMFCPAGSYCPTNTQEIPCEHGHYCRMGSTAETRCYKMTSCDTSTTSQNITLYGVMLIVAVVVVLFIFRNCYEKISNFKVKRYARSREVAVKSVENNARARARWLAAKDEVIKRAVEMQRSLSCTSITIPIELDISIQEIEEHHVTTAGVKQENGNQDKKKQLEPKHIRGDTQIFKYAYSQLQKERERALQQGSRQHTSFSRVISMTMSNEIRKRPRMEIAFRDLTVSLKHNKKHLLKSVTGEIWPGRITALMGPSGAGKTTLLSALAGKTIGCSISGQVLINGQVESIRSYKKIVGFVPQDDIVHGNLTVEENIWFTANCRLSADLPIADKVLVVERVIESLGLQPVRNSLVGTVEKRGISGGQRKRVNVGLEMVMEPSLLLLDEPTSGLDSSSSQLLLRALRQEALKGVNICMVVHQPSYSLFKMFDDLILLAKGGLTVYHGPVRDVENYFAGLGINVPERINPPDHYIDVLEGMVKPTTNSGITCEELPLRWMFHKGYDVPPDMQNRAGGSMPLNSGNQENSVVSGHHQSSIWGVFWHNVEHKLEAWSGVLQNNFMRSKDLSRRRTPSILLQYRYFVGRMTKQRLREARIQAIDYLILLLAGACLGLISKAADENFGAPGYTYTIIATSLLCKIAALRTFALDKLQYQRERASGISSLAHFVAKDTVDHFNTLIKPLFYLSTFYFFSNPRSYFLDNYIVLLCLVYCVTGMAYMLAIFLEPHFQISDAIMLMLAGCFFHNLQCSVILPVVLTLLSTQPKDSELIKILSRLCYPSWALEAFIVSNAKRYYGVWLIQRCGALLRLGYNLHHWTASISLLLAAGAGFRILAFIGMLTLRKT